MEPQSDYNFTKAFAKCQEDFASTPELYSSAAEPRVRGDFSRRDFEKDRSSYKIPAGKNQRELHEIMRMCNHAYESVGVVRSVIDMMSEFAADSVEIVHPDAGPNNFYKAWSRQVDLEDRAERFASWLCRSGNVVVRRRFQQLSPQAVRRWRRTQANDGLILENTNASGQIPLSYVFYNPADVELVGDELGTLSDKKLYGLRILAGSINNRRPRTPNENKVYDLLPDEIKKAIEGKRSITNDGYLIPIPTDKVFVGHYKKDDTDMWAKSFLYSILKDIIYNDKLKLAKMSTLDNMINVIRLWRLGDHKEGIEASKAQAQTLARVLSNNTGGGPLDIIWTSDIDLKDFYPPIQELANFKEDYNNILLGLGVVLTIDDRSASTSSLTTTLGLQNVVKRIEAVRRVLKQWLNAEIDIIQKNMGFRKRPVIRFAHANLTDPRVYYDLLIKLVDRNIISEERVLEAIKDSPEIEAVRVREEMARRERGEKPDKAGPFYNPQLNDQQDHEMEKLEENSNNLSKDRGNSENPNGRPPGSNDKVPRNPKETTNAELLSWALEASRATEKFVQEVLGCTNGRKLTTEQRAQIDKTVLQMLPRLRPLCELSEDDFIEAYRSEDPSRGEFGHRYKTILTTVPSDRVTIEQKHLFRALALASV